MTPAFQRAREMRQAMSAPEVMLWSRLKRLRGQGYHFRRQAPFRGYFLDFVCYTRRVAVEVDGGQYGEDRQSEHDFVRDRVLARHGFRVLRFWASDVRGDLTWVMDQVIAALEAQPSTRLRMDDLETPRSGPNLPTLTAARSVPPH